jgi:ubiquinone/menaquinone biosynthesis C-methylase UbiE
MDKLPHMSLAQYAMQHPLLAPIYERVWRPTAFLTAMAFDLRHFRAEKAKAVQALRLGPGKTVLDIACGPGNFTDLYAAEVGPTGKAIGLDLSKPMLDRALVDNADTGASYVLASGHRLPFADGSFDAVACYGALCLIPDPLRVVDEMIRVVRPRGRIAIMTSLASENPTLHRVQARVAAPAGLSLFGRDELTARLRSAGFTDIGQESHGVLQYVAATAPA